MKVVDNRHTDIQVSTDNKVRLKIAARERISNNTMAHVFCFETECIMTLQGHRRSILARIVLSTYGTYWTSIVTLVLSCRVSRIGLLEVLDAKKYFSISHPYPGKNFVALPLEYGVL